MAKILHLVEVPRVVFDAVFGGVHRHAFALAFFVVLAIWIPSFAHGATSYYSYKTVRSPLHELGYGGLSYAITPENVNPYTNPASMQFVNHTIVMAGLRTSFNAQGLSYALNFVQGGGALTANMTSEALERLLADDALAVGELDAFTMFVANNKAFGLYANTRTVGFPQELKPIAKGIPDADKYEPFALSYDATNTVGVYYAHSISYLNSVYFGYNLQFAVRQTMRQIRLVDKLSKGIITAESPDAGDKKLSSINMALLGDTTLAYILEDMPLSPTFVFFAKDIGGQLYSFNGLTTKVGVGTSVSGNLGPVRITSGAEIGNILLNTLTVPGIIRQIRAGSEITLGNGLISLRGGMYNARPTLGFGIFSYPISIDYASYYEELVGIPALKGEDKFIPGLNRPTESRIEQRQSISMRIPF